MKEVRNALELRSQGRVLSGYAAVFDKPSSDLGGWTEIVAPSAFDRALGEGQDVVALFDHDRRSILGRSGPGTLRLSTDSRGLHFEIEAPNTTLGRDVVEMVRRGDVTGASFAFTPREDRWENEVRTLLDVDLHDVTITPNPAYPDATVAMRSLRASTAISAEARARRIRLLEIGA